MRDVVAPYIASISSPGLKDKMIEASHCALGLAVIIELAAGRGSMLNAKQLSNNVCEGVAPWLRHVVDALGKAGRLASVFQGALGQFLQLEILT